MHDIFPVGSGSQNQTWYSQELRAQEFELALHELKPRFLTLVTNQSILKALGHGAGFRPQGAQDGKFS